MMYVCGWYICFSVIYLIIILLFIIYYTNENNKIPSDSPVSPTAWTNQNSVFFVRPRYAPGTVSGAVNQNNFD